MIQKLVNIVRAALSVCPLHFQLNHTDRYIDHSLVVVSVNGIAAAYVKTPDGQVTARVSKGTLADARRLGYEMHEAQYARWIKRAGSEELMSVRDAESASRMPNQTLINAIQMELFNRSDLNKLIGLRMAA